MNTVDQAAIFLYHKLVYSVNQYIVGEANTESLRYMSETYQVSLVRKVSAYQKSPTTKLPSINTISLRD